MAFVKFQIEDMKAALATVANGPVVEATDEMQESSEVILKVPTSHERVSVLVYTTYVPANAESRECGEDAIRFVIRYNGHREIKRVGNLKRVNRTSTNGAAGLLQRVLDRVKHLIDLATPLRKCECGSLLVPRYAGDDRFFYGCLEFPKCRESDSID